MGKRTTEAARQKLGVSIAGVRIYFEPKSQILSSGF
jgi:hypothetical protein